MSRRSKKTSTTKHGILRQFGRATAIALAWALSLAATMLPARAQTFKSLYSFTGGNDGAGGNGPLIWDKEGNLYGTAGGSANGGNGTVWKLGPSGKLTVLYTFPGQGGNGNNGANPNAGLVRDSEGNFYGLTGYGGDGCTGGCGVVYKLTPSGEETVLHNFQSSPNDGALPLFVPLVPGPSGLFYGTTAEGGDGVCVYSFQGMCGVVFSVNTAGNETVIHNFQGSPYDGMEPWTNLVQDAQGNLYGTAMGGGDYAGAICGGLGDDYNWNCGAIFKLSPNSNGSWAESILYSFTGGTDGSQPSSLAIDAKGNLYGGTLLHPSSKCLGGCGTLYELDTSGKFTVLHSFTGGSDGMRAGGLVLDASGNLYGSALGGSHGDGLVFKLDTAGKFTVLHSFKGSDGARPSALSHANTGILYGVTGNGGVYGYGTVFEIVF